MGGSLTRDLRSPQVGVCSYNNYKNINKITEGCIAFYQRGRINRQHWCVFSKASVNPSLVFATNLLTSQLCLNLVVECIKFPTFLVFTNHHPLYQFLCFFKHECNSLKLFISGFPNDARKHNRRPLPSPSLRGLLQPQQLPWSIILSMINK